MKKKQRSLGKEIIGGLKQFTANPKSAKVRTYRRVNPERVHRNAVATIRRIFTKTGIPKRPKTIERIAKKWTEFIMKVHEHGVPHVAAPARRRRKGK